MKSGLTLIHEEQAEHKAKHGYSPFHDDSHNCNGELFIAASAIFSQMAYRGPTNWAREFFDKVLAKPRVNQLVIAGSLVLAEINRFQRLEKRFPGSTFAATIGELQKSLNAYALLIDNCQINEQTIAALTLLDYTTKNPTPWASMMETGVKTDESRKWPMPKTREMPFDCLICASASSKSENAGLAVCVVEIYQCLPFTEEFEKTVGCERYDGFVFRTRNLRWLSRKFPVKGQLGFFGVDFPDDVKLLIPTSQQLLDAKVALLANLKLP